jgi:hypothetical protein
MMLINKRTRKSAVWLILTVLLCFAVISVAYAMNMHGVSQQNHLQSRNTGIEIVKDFAGSTVLLDFVNTGSSPVFLRITYLETWENGGAWLQDDGMYCIKNWTDNFFDDWILIDGWYYYKKVLPAGGNTGNILNSIEFPGSLVPEYSESSYTLDFLAEAVQLSSETAVNAQATLAVFNRTAAVTVKSTQNGMVTSGYIDWD